MQIVQSLLIVSLTNSNSQTIVFLQFPHREYFYVKEVKNGWMECFKIDYWLVAKWATFFALNKTQILHAQLVINWEQKSLCQIFVYFSEQAVFIYVAWLSGRKIISFAYKRTRLLSALKTILGDVIAPLLCTLMQTLKLRGYKFLLKQETAMASEGILWYTHCLNRTFLEFSSTRLKLYTLSSEWISTGCHF